MKILVIDDHHLIRDGIRPLLRELAGAGEPVVVVEAATFAEGLAVADRHPDLELALLDLHLPDVTGFEALDEIQRRHPEVPVVVMSGDDDSALMREAIERGALGYIPKSSSSGLILNALRLVLSGGTYVPREILEAGTRPSTPQTATTRDALVQLDLTPRQKAVLELLVAGKSNKAICRELDLAEGTVKNHIAAIFKALNVTTRVQAVIVAGKLGVKP